MGLTLKKQISVIDFETDAIQERPRHPPMSNGVAINHKGKSRYYAWGHPSDNGIYELDGRGGVKLLRGRKDPRFEAQALMWEIYDSDCDILFHNSKFDLDVAEKHHELPLPDWFRVHDTLFRLFLVNPHMKSLSLKPASEEILGLKPDEQDEVRDWLVDNGVIGRNENHGAHICKAPGNVVGKYAIGDVDRTLALHLHKRLSLDAGMTRAYDRERQLVQILLRNEREGMRVDVDALTRDIPVYARAHEKVEGWLRRALGSRDLNFDDDKSVGDALFESKIVTDWVWTKGGKNRAPQRSVARANMTADRFNDKRVFQALDYRNRLQTVMSMSMVPWLAQAGGSGKIHTEWNQVRQSSDDGSTKGVRTGRLSCSRFMNISKKYTGHTHPKFLGLPELPLVRRYILPDKGHVWLHRDYKQQEFKVLAHFEDADLKAAYLQNPNMDQHDAMMVRLQAQGYDVVRDTAKMVNLAILYALGIQSLAVKLKMSEDDARKIKNATKAAMPGVAALEAEVKARACRGEPVRTWGGRLIYCKPPSVAKTGPRKGQEVTYEYTLLNHLIQGSSADCTKEAIIQHDAARKGSRLLVPVHDEINISAPEKYADREDQTLKRVMEGVEFDVAMLTDPKRGSSWGNLKAVD